MNDKYKSALALLLALVMMICMTACGGSDDSAAAEESAGAQTEETGPETEAGDAEEPEEALKVVRTIEGIDEDLGGRLPMQIESITLFEDGSVAIVPTDDLKKNEIKDDSDAVYPFEESGEAADVYVVDYGNGGYRTIIALMKDGSVSAVNGRALIEDHIFAVMDNVANRDNFVKVENRTDEDASSIVATTEDGEEVILDYSLNFDEPEQ